VWPLAFCFASGCSLPYLRIHSIFPVVTGYRASLTTGLPNRRPLPTALTVGQHPSAPLTTSNMPKRSSRKRRSSRRRHGSSSSPTRHRRRRSHRHRDRTPSRGRRSHRHTMQNVSATPVTPASIAALVSASVTTATKSILNSIRSTPSRRLFAESRDGQLLRNGDTQSAKARRVAGRQIWANLEK